jgi:hypothetical protein
MLTASTSMAPGNKQAHACVAAVSVHEQKLAINCPNAESTAGRALHNSSEVRSARLGHLHGRVLRGS